MRKSVGRGGAEASLRVPGRWPAVRAGWRWGSYSNERHHDVSIVIGLSRRVLGVEPRSNVSMMIMRPPQHGHGGECVSGSSALAARGSTYGVGTTNKARAPAKVSGR